jgi:hypothetical protein
VERRRNCLSPLDIDRTGYRQVEFQIKVLRSGHLIMGGLECIENLKRV